MARKQTNPPEPTPEPEEKPRSNTVRLMDDVMDMLLDLQEDERRRSRRGRRPLTEIVDGFLRPQVTRAHAAIKKPADGESK